MKSIIKKKASADEMFYRVECNNGESYLIGFQRINFALTKSILI